MQQNQIWIIRLITDISQIIGNAGELQKDESVTTTLSEKHGCEYYKIIIDEESKVIINYKSNAGQSTFQLYDNELSLIKEEKVKAEDTENQLSIAKRLL